MGVKQFLGPLENAGFLEQVSIGAIGRGSFGIDGGGMLAQIMLARHYEAIAREGNKRRAIEIGQRTTRSYTLHTFIDDASKQDLC